MKKELVEIAARAVDYTLSDPPEDVDLDSLVSFAVDVVLDDQALTGPMLTYLRQHDSEFGDMVEAMIKFRRSTMDPNVCLRELILGALYDKNIQWEDAREAINQLIEWLDNGGFVPTPTRAEWKSILAALSAFCDEHIEPSGDGPPYDAATATGMYDRDC